MAALVHPDSAAYAKFFDEQLDKNNLDLKKADSATLKNMLAVLEFGPGNKPGPLNGDVLTNVGAFVGSAKPDFPTAKMLRAIQKPMRDQLESLLLPGLRDALAGRLIKAAEGTGGMESALSEFNWYPFANGTAARRFVDEKNYRVPDLNLPWLRGIVSNFLRARGYRIDQRNLKCSKGRWMWDIVIVSHARLRWDEDYDSEEKEFQSKSIGEKIMQIAEEAADGAAQAVRDDLDSRVRRRVDELES